MRKLRRLIRSCCGKVLLQLTVHSVGFLSRIRTRSPPPQTKVASTPPHACHIVLPGRQVPADPRKPAHLRRPVPAPSEGDHLRAASQKRGLPRQCPGGADLSCGGPSGRLVETCPAGDSDGARTPVDSCSTARTTPPETPTTADTAGHPKTFFNERKPPTLLAGPSKPRPDRLALDTSDSLASCENAVSSSATTHHRPARFG